jgi:hypothetical protein
VTKNADENSKKMPLKIQKSAVENSKKCRSN